MKTNQLETTCKEQRCSWKGEYGKCYTLDYRFCPNLKAFQEMDQQAKKYHTESGVMIAQKAHDLQDSKFDSSLSDNRSSFQGIECAYVLKENWGYD